MDLAIAAANLSAASQAAVQRLVLHHPERPDLSVNYLVLLMKFTYFLDSSAFPRSKLAAVLILLFEEAGELRVLLTTRSKDLRTHPGQTALPGGRVDESDITVMQTAYREAHEEVGLPLNSPDIRTLGTLRPFISLHRLVVTPVVALLTDPSVISTLKASEDESTTDSAVALLNGSNYRMHRFRSSATPIKGLTADILIHAAEIAFDRPPQYDRWAEGQPRAFAATIQLLA
ncbi:NUDIX hydrolase domain-like protein [Mycena galopus ATCC 62051]|nr:NUDIX hydrolase domain-like protein [Mycena galopus ATCC 62051]